jgi:hypothetical protein
MLPDYDWDELAALWDGNHFRAVHDWLNKRWGQLMKSRVLRDDDPDARFLQGLAFAALALHFTQDGNQVGALMMIDDATIFLAPYVPSHQGVAVEPVLQSLAELRPMLVGLPPDAQCPMQPFVYRKFRLTRATA